jgi:hypothetical protein
MLEPTAPGPTRRCHPGRKNALAGCELTPVGATPSFRYLTPGAFLTLIVAAFSP